MLIETSLVANDDSHRDNVSFIIPSEEWEHLIHFRRHVDALRTTSFVREGHGGGVSLKWAIGEGLRVEARHVDEEPVWAMLLKLRPFVLQNERSFLPSILNVLKRRLVHPAFHRHIDSLRDAFNLKLLEKRMSFRGPGRQLMSHQVVMDWLNSYHYHQDIDKRAVVIRDLGQLSESQDGMGTVLIALVDMVQSALGAGDFIETLERCTEGTMPVIRCPPNYFDADAQLNKI